MPVPGFLSSFADKAQSAVAQHLPSSHRPSSPDSSAQPTANSAAQGGGVAHKNPTLEAIQYQIRSLGQQYGSTSPVQKIITTGKGVAIDLDSVSRDAKAQSKELYTWGQGEDEDIKDVTDRLAYLNFVSGSLASSLATKLDAARAPLKALRDAETAIAPRRNVRAGLQTQLARLEHDNQKGMEKKIAELKEQLRKAEHDDKAQENEIDLLKRKGVRESEQLKWEAVREYGEKLVLLSQAAYPVITALPTLPPTPSSPYTGAQATGAARASLQRALDNYRTGHINLPPQAAGSDLSRSDTRSFGESHASELSSMTSDVSEATHTNLPVTPPAEAKAPSLNPPVLTSALKKPSESSASIPAKSQSPPINPSNLNLSPAPGFDNPSSSSLGPSNSTPVPIVAPDPLKPNAPISTITPTVAETGVPISTGQSGPGPASGSLRDVKAASPTAGPRTGGLPSSGSMPHTFGAMGAPPTGSAKFESAEEEKKRLAAEYSQAHSAAPSAPQYESADDEKKRLEREEREKLLRSGGTDAGTSGTKLSKKDDDELPPYQDI